MMECKRIGPAALGGALLLLLAAGCRTQPSAASPPPEAQTPSPAEAAEQTAVGWLAEEGHAAFPVGDHWVTAVGREARGEFYDYEVTLSVWDPEHMEEPVQTMTKEIESMVFGHSQVVDANFDGEPDFGWAYFLGNQPSYWYYWIWDEEQGRFAEEPAFSRDEKGQALGGISAPVFDDRTRTVSGFARSSGAGTGVNTIHRWEGGRLVCVRRVEAEADPEFDTVSLTVEDRREGSLTEVFRRDYPMEGDWFAQRDKWLDLAYQAEP